MSEKNTMELILCGTAGYEAEHTARMFFSGLLRSDRLPEQGDYLLISAKPFASFVLLHRDGLSLWQALPADPIRMKNCRTGNILSVKCSIIFYRNRRESVPTQRSTVLGHDDRGASGADNP